jgi:ketosteroid isomerase-like protein
VERLFQGLIEHDLDMFHDQFHEDSVIEFPQSGERIVGDKSRRSVYGSFRGRPSVRRIHTGGHLAVVEASVDYGDAIDWRAVFIFELRNGKIAKATAYWTQPFEPAELQAE